MRRLLAAFGLAAILAVPSAAIGLAAAPDHESFKVDETFPENLCGLDVTTHVVGTGNVLMFEDHFVDLSVLHVTWTNIDGDWLTLFFAGPAAFTETLDGDILTVVGTHRGVHEMVRSSDGLTPAFDRGRAVVREVIDLNDLEDEQDDVFLSSEILLQAGPHPEADSGFELFCEVVVDVLG
jgi:hypothetical protein